MPAPPTGPLAGVRILDCTIWQNGPFATVMLSDLGAEVIKVEDRTAGDPGRGLMDANAVSGVSGYFEAMNRNKRSISLDLKSAQGRAVFHRLTARVDVVVQNFRHGVAEKLGISWADLSPLNPRLIYASATGFGREGPDATIGVFDILGQARSGLLHALRMPGDVVEYSNAFGLADQTGGILLAQAITAALYARERTGKGQEVEVSQLGAMLSLQQMGATRHLINGYEPAPTRRTAPKNPVFNLYACADEEWLAVGGLQADRYWADFCTILGLAELGRDPACATMAQRTAQSAALVARLDAAFAARTRADLLARFAAAGIPAAPVNTWADLADDPQVTANGYIATLDHPTLGPIREIGQPIRFSETPAAPRFTAPELGQHTEEVLLEHGFGWDEIIALREADVL
ncbi:MAG: CoA transferase [Sphingomonadales bacterium]|nr:CoA transferase [Sphingomonadales bacterium]